MCLVAYILALSLFVAPASQPRVVEMETCHVGLTPAGRSAAFAATTIYQADVTPGGYVSTIKRVSVPDFFIAFVEVDKFE